MGEAPENGGVSTRGEILAKELNLERSDFVFDRHIYMEVSFIPDITPSG